MTYETLGENTVPNTLTDDECMRVVEAVLFAAGYPVGYAKLAAVTGRTPSEIRRLITDRADEYNSPGNIPRGIMLLTFGDSCQLCTREELGGYVRDALGIKRGGNLSASSLEVLAIVAYNEPVTRAFIDTVRGVDSAYAVNSLCDKHLIEVCGRLDVPGRPMLYRTTEDFLRVFGISSLGELPEVASKPEEAGGNISMENIIFTEQVDSADEPGEGDVPVSDGDEL